jgi:hypothetical protein
MIVGGSLDFVLYRLCTNECHTESKQYNQRGEREKQHITPKATFVTVVIIDDKMIKTTVSTFLNVAHPSKKLTRKNGLDKISVN